jgi:glycosyltransferase involved in cell wall biosynthesis
MVRVLFINQYYWPDVAATAQHLADLAEDLAERGFAVDVLCSQGDYQSAGSKNGKPALPLMETWRGVGIRRLASWGGRAGGILSRLTAYAGFHAQAALWVARYRASYDVIVTLTEPPLIGLHALLGRRARHIIWCMDLYTDCLFALGSVKESSPLGLSLEAMNRIELKHADAIVALGDCMRDRLVAKGIASERIRTIGVWNKAEELWPTSVEGNPLRAEHGLADKFVVMYSGNAGRSHSFRAIQHAMSALRDHPTIRFLFVGGGKRGEEIDDYVDREKLANVLKLPYFPRERLNDSLAMGDVHLVSLHERMAGVVVPSKLYGAFAVGRPILYVGPQESTIARNIRDADAGASLANDDGPGLVRAIERLAADRAERERLGCNAHAFFLQRYERKVCCDAWAETLVDLCAG